VLKERYSKFKYPICYLCKLIASKIILKSKTFNYSYVCPFCPLCALAHTCLDCPLAVSFACIDFEFRCLFFCFSVFLCVWLLLQIYRFTKCVLLCRLSFALSLSSCAPFPHADRQRTHASLIYGACAFIGPLPNDTEEGGKGEGMYV